MIRILYRYDDQVVCESVNFLVFEEKNPHIWFNSWDGEIYVFDVSPFEADYIMTYSTKYGFSDLRKYSVRLYKEN